MKPRHVALCLLVLVPPLLGVALLPTAVDTPWASLALIGLLALGQLAWHLRRLALSRLLLWPMLAWLTLCLLGFLLPEHWMPHAGWNRLAEALIPGTHVEDWQPTLLVVVTLALLGLSLLVRTRANLGAPLLLALAGLTLGGQALAGLQAPPLMPLTVAWPLLATQGVLLSAQLTDVQGGWRGTRGSVRRALWPSLLLALLSLAFWHHQKNLGDHQLRAEVAAQGQRLADRLSREIDDHLAAMRRFAAFWDGRPATPGTASWARLADLYHQDFRYFLDIAFIDPDSRIRRVHPPTAVNRSILGTRLYDAQPEGRSALRATLEEGRIGRTGIIRLLQGEPGLIHYLPVRSTDDGAIRGAVGMAVGLTSLAETLFRQVDPRTTGLFLLDGERLLAYQGPDDRQGPWRHAAHLDLSGLALTLVTRPSRDDLLARRSRQPEISLVVGLTLAYVLYLALFARHRLVLQHRQVRRSNRELRREMRSRIQLQQDVAWLAEHDELTRLPNRRRFLQVLDDQAETRPLSVLLCDVDHFKWINDRLGHLVGDRYLTELGRLGQAVIDAAGGTFARFGGEEFVACLPGHDADAATAVAEELRARLAESGLTHQDGAPLTISIGVATQTAGKLIADDLLQTADEALYRAKSRGRDRVERGPALTGLLRAGA